MPVILVVVLVGAYVIYKGLASSSLSSCRQFNRSCLTESKESTIVRLYVAVLGRSPSRADVAYWSPKLQDTSINEAAKIAQWFIQSQEFKRAHPEFATITSGATQTKNEAFVTLVRQQLFGELPSILTIAYEADKLTTKAVTPAVLVARLVQSSEAKQALLNKVAVVVAVQDTPLCTARRGATQDIAGPQQSAYRQVELPQNTIINATTAKWDGLNTANQPITWATIVDGQGGNCWYGGRFIGAWNDRSPDVTWENPYHHSAGMTIRTNNFLVEGFRVHNQGDGIRMESRANNFHIRNVYLSDIHDDCVENDGFNNGLTEGSLFDGCYSGFSAANTVGNGSNNTWRIQNNLLRMKPFHTIYKPEKYVARGCKIPSHHGLFKGWSSNNPGPNVVLKNNIFMAEEIPCSGTLDIPPNMKLSECRNNTFVWLGKGPFPYTLPSCIRVTTDKRVWDNAVSRWKQQHPSVGW